MISIVVTLLGFTLKNKKGFYDYAWRENYSEIILYHVWGTFWILHKTQVWYQNPFLNAHTTCLFLLHVNKFITICKQMFEWTSHAWSFQAPPFQCIGLATIFTIPIIRLVRSPVSVVHRSPISPFKYPLHRFIIQSNPDLKCMKLFSF